MQIDTMFIAIAITLCGIYIIVRQQRTIDRLTDKLVAGDYRIYKSLEGVKEEDVSPLKEDEPLSFYDH